MRSERVNTGGHIISDLLPSSTAPKWLFDSAAPASIIFVKLPIKCNGVPDAALPRGQSDRPHLMGRPPPHPPPLLPPPPLFPPALRCLCQRTGANVCPRPPESFQGLAAPLVTRSKPLTLGWRGGKSKPLSEFTTATASCYMVRMLAPV